MDLIEIPGLKALLQDLNPTVPTKKVKDHTTESLKSPGLNVQ